MGVEAGASLLTLVWRWNSDRAYPRGGYFWGALLSQRVVEMMDALTAWYAPICTSASGGRTEPSFMKRADVGAVRVPSTSCAEMAGSAARRQAGLPGRAPRGNRPLVHVSRASVFPLPCVPVRVSRCRVHGARPATECPCEAEQQHWGHRCGTLAQGVAHVCHMSFAILCHPVSSCSKRSRKGTMLKKQSCPITPLRSPCQTAL